MRSAARNWAGNYTYRARRLHRPLTLEQVRETVASAPRIRVLGSRHSFNGIADSAELVTLDALPADVTVDHAARTVSVPPAPSATGSLRRRSTPKGSRSRTSLRCRTSRSAGAVATATHGSGDGNGNLATAVAALELVTSDGEILTAAPRRPGLRGARRRTGRARRRHADHARRRVRLRGAAARLQGARMGRAVRALRRDQLERPQRQRLHALE